MAILMALGNDQPKTIFPLAVLLTLLIEVFGIKLFNKELALKYLIKVVLAANIVSFLVPYIERAFRFIPTSGGFSLSAAFDKGPYYMIMAGYLVLTLLVEIPIVFLLLKKHCVKPVKLLVAIVMTNILTTGVVALLERVFCKGMW